ncbi:hypothetical protein [Tuwongella immobilis]|uniref:Carboxypeptidase regulatory-like domain-containing protein n=1 Tax=Tuwongella immobilis TaxID=692036 RepID=A0A6C2YTM8_9BACT|nr:hypothetical protein [Tuwongella immobilis]VIP04774.1 Uncharacterized protein OS=Pirellula staleyi (strain ATCC 27377 / DSM 6068 / ICPB 4128) GN=Psta_0323 PE=4 SV=1 [Tuwongella immobilis]VTS06907.1 Uncharacterized protein OS=Pirellula staleyi (strain ATCC 27377 / DSM 6068 / ICPB 4128) GN=Psta_0323 PE=4 SV=1 [Tuwongella immobilis]
MNRKTQSRIVQRFSGGILLVGMLLTVGCQDSLPPRDPVVPVSGSVRFQGAAVAGGAITFHPAQSVENPRATRSLGSIDKDGNYQLTTYDTHDGAPPGEYVVTIYWPGKLPAGSPIGEVGPDRLKGKYANPKTTKLKATVKDSPNTIDFDLP